MVSTTGGLSISSKITCTVPKVLEIVLRSNSFSSFRIQIFFLACINYLSASVIC